MKKLVRLWFPLLVFLAFLSALFSSDLVVERLGTNISLVAKNTFIYGVQIGVWLSAALLFNRLLEVFFWDGFVGALSGRKVPRLPKDVTALALFLLAAAGVMATVFEQSITGILATSGVASIIIGLALRNVILDMFIGLAIHVERPFKIGDWIQVHRNRSETHIIAKVIEINWRTTRLRTTQNNMIVVPNNVIGTSILTNYMEPKPHFRIDLPFIIDFEVPANRASRVLQAGIMAVAGENGILENPEPEVRLKEATLEGQLYEVRFFILPVHISPNESKDVVNRSVLEQLKRSGLTPAQPKEEIYISKQPKRNLDIGQDKDIYELLSRTELFRNLNIEELMQVFSGMKRRELRQGDTLYRQGDKGHHVPPPRRPAQQFHPCPRIRGSCQSRIHQGRFPLRRRDGHVRHPARLDNACRYQRHRLRNRERPDEGDPRPTRRPALHAQRGHRCQLQQDNNQGKGRHPQAQGPCQEGGGQVKDA